MSRPGYVDRRGSAKARARRRVWLLATFDPELGNELARCRLRLAAECHDVVNAQTLSVDRIEQGGSYRRGNIQPACKPCQDKQGGLAAVRINSSMIDAYRYARDASEALRESGLPAPSSVPGVAGSQAAYYQLSEDEFDQHVPALTFREWLIEWHAGTSQAAQDRAEGSFGSLAM